MLSLLGGVFLGWSLGANDASNVFGPAVTSKMIKFWTAALLAAVFVLIGALLQGHAGIHTLKGLTAYTIEEAVVCSLAAAVTVTFMTILSLPVSTSQAVIGGILGIAFLNRELNFEGLGKVVTCWIGTPIGGAVIAVIAYQVVGILYNRLRLNLFVSDSLIRMCLLASALYGAYALGANNVANVTAVFVGAGRLSLFTATLVGGLSIGLGILTYSSRVTQTVGRKLVKLDAYSAFIVLLAEAVTVHIYSFVGVPVSTSQAVIGAVFGVGLVRGIKTLHRGTLGIILAGWLFTPFLAALISVALAYTLR